MFSGFRKTVTRLFKSLRLRYLVIERLPIRYLPKGNKLRLHQKSWGGGGSSCSNNRTQMQQEALKDTRPEPGGSHRCPPTEKRQGLEFILLYVKSVQNQSVMGETRIVVSSRFCVCSIYSEEV